MTNQESQLINRTATYKNVPNLRSGVLFLSGKSAKVPFPLVSFLEETIWINLGFWETADLPLP